VLSSRWIAPAALSLFAVACRDIPPEPDVVWEAGVDAFDATPNIDAPRDTIPDVDANPYDAPPSIVTPDGGMVGRLHFAVFGDVRPNNPNDTANYPSGVIGSVMQGIADLGAQFAVASGDYMFAYTSDVANAQIDLLLHAESNFGGVVFHALGNHECNTATMGNCPNGDETGNILAFHARLAPQSTTPYYDWVIHTSEGDAHFVATAPNAWSNAQSQWLDTALAQPARYVFVIAHEPPTSSGLPAGSMAIEAAIAARTGGVTLRLYGHTHDYRHIGGNAVISGNAGAPLGGFGGFYGFLIVDQLASGDITVTSYEIGTPPLVNEMWSVHPDGSVAF
jgi:hypothetical protein